MNKLLFAIGAAAVACGAHAVTVELNGVTWTYVVNDADAKTVTLGDGTNPAMPTNTTIDAKYIPWTFTVGDDKYTVSQIAGKAFKNCSGLTGTLNIPPTVKKYTGHQAFYGTGLTGVSSFGDGLVAGNANIQETYVGSQLTGVVVVPDSYPQSLGYKTFDHCTNLTGIVVGTGTTEIAWYFASWSDKLQGVWVKGMSTVTSGTQTYTPVSMRCAFRDCKNLKVVLCGANTKLGGGIWK